MNTESILVLPIESITIGDRFRKDMGDLATLSISISENGLLQPIGVTPEHVLVFGERRLRACGDYLGWAEIPCRVISPVNALEAERAENEARKDTTVQEKVAIARAIEARIGNRQGQRTDHEPPQNFAEVTPGQETRDIAAKKAGFGNRETYRQAETVIDHGTPDLVAAVDSGKVAVSTAATIATAPPERQQEILALTPPAIVDAAKGIRREKQAERMQQKAVPFDRLIEDAAAHLHKILVPDRDPNMEKIGVVQKFKADAPPLAVFYLTEALRGLAERAGAIADELEPFSRRPGD